MLHESSAVSHAFLRLAAANFNASTRVLDRPIAVLSNMRAAYTVQIKQSRHVTFSDSGHP